MDLEGFDASFDSLVNGSQGLTNINAWSMIDSWFYKASRSARWMDLLGDYAGSEPFIIDGEGLLQIVLDDPLLSIGKDGCSFQILHAYHILESTLEQFQRRGANFEIVFWDDTKHATIQTGSLRYTVASRLLARSMLFNHLVTLPFRTHAFKNIEDPLWTEYNIINKPMFVMMNDGNSGGATITTVTFYQRTFMLSLLTNGISVALLRGAEYRESKILSFVYEPLRGAVSVLEALKPAIKAAHSMLETGFKSDRYRLRTGISPASIENDDHIANLFRRLDISSPTIPPEIGFIFLVHILLVPSLTVQKRAQKYRPLNPTLEDIVLKQFLSPLFIKLAEILVCQNLIVDLDGVIFSVLLHLILSHSKNVEEILGHMLHRQAKSIWSLIGGAVLQFGLFASQYPPPKDSTSSSQISMIAKMPMALLPFNNSVFNKEFAIFDSLVSKTDLIINSPTERVRWSDDRHWHNQKTILPSHLGGAKLAPSDPRAVQRRLRSDQRFMAVLQTQAATLTGAAGASLRQIIIAPGGKNKSVVAERIGSAWNKKQVKEPTPTSAEKLRLQIRQQKTVTMSASAEVKWTEHLSRMSKQLLSNRLDSIEAFLRNANLNTTPYVLVEMRLYRIQVQLELWISENDRASSDVRDKHTLALMRGFQEICRDKVITPSTKKSLTSMLIVLGFRDYVGCLSALEIIEHAPSFTFIKLISSKTGTVRSGYEFMAITEHPTIWQLRLFGDYMDRSMDSCPDVRVPFEPDAWQRRVLDGIDQNKSLLVVAPTSAGKTFISFYAMEKVLRESDDGILVYIAPTKALVTQIAAEVYARFRKDLNGRSCWAIHTRDFRIHDPQKCQILVTVPEMLAIMLLTPLTAKNWTPRIKRIVLDEIHSIGQQEGGAVWEQILLLAPCPVIGLSATIGSPEIFSNWLASVQKAHGFEYDFIEHHTRYSHLRKFFYLIDGKGKFESVRPPSPTKRMKFMHPITTLLFGTQKIPSDLSLEAADTLSLYYALFSVQKDIAHDLRPLEPSKFFDHSSLLRQKDVLDYELKLKDIVTDLLSSFDPRNIGSPLGGVIQYLQKQAVWTDSEADAQETVSALGFQNDLLTLLCDLNAQNDLPAILFSFDRAHCEIMARHILQELKSAEERWRSESPEWSRKIKEWVAWKIAFAARERASAKAKKQNRKQKKDDDVHDSSDATWHSSFDPKRPSAQFTFVGQRVDYSISQLEEDIQALAWAPIPGWAFAALRRGIAVHHAGMNKQYRSLIESLFRKGFIRVMIATGTLALGINAPAKTSVFVNDSPYLTALMYRQCAGRAGRRGFDLRGNVVFYGLPLDRVRRLVLSRLPTLGGNFPLTATMTLRLFNMLHGSGDAAVAVGAIKSMITLPQITVNSDFGQDQLLHHVRFSIEYLRRSSLLDREGKPIGLSAIAAHLYYTEPSNLAFVALYKSGVLHDICNQDDIQSAKKSFMLVMCNLFGRRYLPSILAKEDNVKKLTTRYPSMIILPHLPSAVHKVLVAHDKEILDIFQCYSMAYAEHVSSVDDTLPLSRFRVGPRSNATQSSLIHNHLQETSIVTKVRSPFIANSGHGDTFDSVTDLTRTTKAGLNLTHQAIPTMSTFINGRQDTDTLHHRLNAYILDFYIHGQVNTLVEANCIRRGEVWYLLEEFTLTLMTVRAALIQMASNTPLGEEDLTLPGIDTELDDQEEASYDAEDKDELSDSSSTSTEVEPSKLHDLLTKDSKLLLVVDQVCEEFTAKFKAMWA